jgi:hypothetical protein
MTLIEKLTKIQSRIAQVEDNQSCRIQLLYQFVEEHPEYSGLKVLADGLRADQEKLKQVLNLFENYYPI